MAHQRKPVKWAILLAHSWGDDDYRRCLRVPLPGNRVLPVCIRCLGLYPLFAVLLALGLTGVLPLHLPAWALWVLPLPSLAEAVTEWVGWRAPSGPLRFILALPLAVGLAALMERFFADPLDLLFWAVVGTYSLIAGIALAVHLRRKIAETAI